MSEGGVTRFYNIITEAGVEQTAAVLRDAPRPMTARELGQSLSGVFGHSCTGDHRTLFGDREVHHISPGFDVHVSRQRLGTWVFDDLTKLAKRGLATREKVGRSVLWSWVGEPVCMDGMEDFPTPSDDDLAVYDVEDHIGALTEAGVEVARTDEVSMSSKNDEFAGSVKLRRNGPLSHFVVTIWDNATPTKKAAALRQARDMVEDPGERFIDPKHPGYCVGRLA